jgi:hypothetical protein
VFDDLPQLLTGEADRTTVLRVTAHLRECDDCRDELVAAIGGHAALMSAAKYAPELVDLDAPALAAGGDVSPIPAPDLSALFAQVRAEVDTQAPADLDRGRATRASRRPARRPWLTAAAAVLLIGVGGGSYLAVNATQTGSPSRSLSLAAFDEGTSSASATLVGNDHMRLDATSLPQLGAGSYYEVWLTNSARTAMAPVGVLNADRKASITVPAAEMASYGAIEVSVQNTAGVGSYSGHSVLRGSYA